MTPTEKASNIAQDFVPHSNIESRATYEEVREACMLMYEWCKEDMLKEYRKELNEIYKHYLEEQKQQLIDKVEDYLANNICNAYNFRGDDISSTFLDDLIKTMEEEQ